MRVTMPEIEQFSTLVGDIYDASLEPALWPDVFEKACGFMGASSANLISQDTIKKNANVHFSWGVDPHYVQLYLEKYCKINPVFPSVVFFDVEKTHWIPDVLPRDEFCRTRFCREYLLPQGYMDGLFSNMDKCATSCALFFVLRHTRDGLVDDEMRHWFGLVIPHVRRALLIGKIIDLMPDKLSKDSKGRFVTGNMGGRPVGSRNKLGEKSIS
jgi:hypothetical protein